MCAAFQVPTTGEYEHVTDHKKKVQESEIENSRTENPIRKASLNKRPWDHESFLDMENFVTPDFGGWYDPNLDFDPWEVAPAPIVGPNDIILLPIWHMAGCGFSLATFIKDCESEYDFDFWYVHGVIVKWEVHGPVAYAHLNAGAMPSSITVQPLPNAAYGSEICVEAWTRSLKDGQIDGHCDRCLKLFCEEECECLGFTPDIAYDAPPEIAAGGTKSLWVDSGGLACPPYTWSVSGTGYSITPQTENDLEVATLTSAAGT